LGNYPDDLDWLILCGFSGSILSFAQSRNTTSQSFNLKNTGQRDGDEVAQLYISNRFVPVVQPMLQLRHFARLHLKKGEEREVVFFIEPQDLSYIDHQMKWAVGDSVFTVMVGAS
jgi:beta-glucosidase